MIVLGCDALNSSVELLMQNHDIKDVIILSNEALLLCKEKDSVDSTHPKLLLVKCNSAEDGKNEFKEIEIFRDKNIVGLFGGDGHAIVLIKNGEIFGWSNNSHGQIGNFEDGEGGMSSFVTVPICIPLNSVVQVACGKSHTLFLVNTGCLYAMGNNEYGQLGIGKKREVPDPTPISCLHGLPILKIVAGGWHSFCITMSGRVFSWGRNDCGQLGLGTTKRKLFPSLMKSFAENSVAFIAAGEHHNAILTKAGELFTFGKGLHGQLGHGDGKNEHVPTRVKELEGSVVTQVACGTNHTVAYVPNCDKIFVFGSNENGQLGTKDIAISEPAILCDEIQTNNFYKVCAQGNITCLLDRCQASDEPSDYRVTDKQRRIMTLDNVCEKAEDSKAENFISELAVPASSFNCLNASFYLADDMCSIECSAIDVNAVRRAAEILTKFTVEKDFAAFINCLEDILIALDDKLCDIEALRFYVIFPTLIENITKAVACGHTKQAQNEIGTRITCTTDIFIEKFMSLKQGSQKFLTKWYQSFSRDNFSPILDFYKHCLEHCLRCNDKLFIEFLLKQLKMLYDINIDKQLVCFEDFYLGDMPGDVLFQEYVVWSDERRGNLQWKGTRPLLLFDNPFLLSVRTKCLLLEFQTKLRLHLHRTMNIEPNILKIRREEDIVTETIREIGTITDLQKPLHVKFVGEEGYDDGALSKELFMLVFHDLKSRCGLFVEDENSRLLWFDRVASTEDNELYEFIGKLCGLGVYNSIIIDLNFPLALYKKLFGVKVDLSDLKELSPVFATSLQQILTFEEDDEMAMEDVFGYFITTDDVPLKKGGGEIPITSANRKEYVELYVEYLLNVSVQTQFKAFSSGFLAVFARNDILHEIFTPEELMKMVGGTQNYDWTDLKKNTTYDMFTPEEETIVWFWDVLFSMSKKEKEEFLVYLTGSNKIPISGLKMKISKREECDDFLPYASVCYNNLFLHSYSTKDILEERLQTAMKCEGFHLE